MRLERDDKLDKKPSHKKMAKKVKIKKKHAKNKRGWEYYPHFQISVAEIIINKSESTEQLETELLKTV